MVGGCYFFPVNLLERRRTLLVDHIDLLRESVRRVKRLYPFHIDAWVVLPDHMHCIWTLPPDTDDFLARRGLQARRNKYAVANVVEINTKRNERDCKSHSALKLS